MVTGVLSVSYFYVVVIANDDYQSIGIVCH